MAGAVRGGFTPVTAAASQGQKTQLFVVSLNSKERHPGQSLAGGVCPSFLTDVGGGALRPPGSWCGQGRDGDLSVCSG